MTNMSQYFSKIMIHDKFIILFVDREGTLESMKTVLWEMLTIMQAAASGNHGNSSGKTVAEVCTQAEVLLLHLLFSSLDWPLET